MGSGIGKEPRKQLQRGGMGLLMRRLIISALSSQMGMFGCGHSLANAHVERSKRLDTRIIASSPACIQSNERQRPSLIP
jgi:hypothetical protein